MREKYWIQSMLDNAMQGSMQLLLIQKKNMHFSSTIWHLVVDGKGE